MLLLALVWPDTFCQRWCWSWKLASKLILVSVCTAFHFKHFKCWHITFSYRLFFFIGNGPFTRIFDGQLDHLVPANSAAMVESELFLMAGRMMGHCFLHGGPRFSGLSPAIIHVLWGASTRHCNSDNWRLSRFGHPWNNWAGKIRSLELKVFC